MFVGCEFCRLLLPGFAVIGAAIDAQCCRRMAGLHKGNDIPGVFVHRESTGLEAGIGDDDLGPEGLSAIRAAPHEQSTIAEGQKHGAVCRDRHVRMSFFFVNTLRVQSRCTDKGSEVGLLCRCCGSFGRHQQGRQK